ncbi:sodium:proton exchanger, partial [bacterium DOLZORAL124_64_63]
AEAKLEGLAAIRANILSEYVEDELELTGLGQLIATTPNDEVNSLAGQHFIHVFGRENIWQVAPTDDNHHHRTAVASHMRGRICFPGRPQHSELERFVAEGAVVKKTTLTKQFTLEDFQKMYGDDHVLLFRVSEDKGLRVAYDGMRTPGAGTTIYALVRPEFA